MQPIEKDLSIKKHELFSRTLLLFMAMLSFVGLTMAAVISFNGSTRSRIVVQTLAIDSEMSFTSSTSSTSLNFTSSAQQHVISAVVTNDCDSTLHYYYTIEADNTELSKAILVYYDDNYIGTLSEVVANETHIENAVNVVGKQSNISNQIMLELHLAAENSYYDHRNIEITLHGYAESADYIDAMYVSNLEEFHKAIDDVNSGLLTNTVFRDEDIQIQNGKLVNAPIIVLLNDIEADGEIIKYPCSIELNGHTLSGQLELDGANALLDVNNNGSDQKMDAEVTLTEFNQEKAEQLMQKRIISRYGSGIESNGSMRLLGTLAFYGSNVTVPANSNYTYSDDVIYADEVTETTIETASVTFSSGSSFAINFKILGSVDSLADKYLSHLPQTADTVVTTDLFLPVSIKEKNATINWTSSDPTVMDNTGKIVAFNAFKEPVSLYAEIRVNDTVYTKKYPFLVTARSNEVNFYKLIAEISPLTIYYVYDEGNKNYTTYYLPVVGTDYDYITGYSTPLAPEDGTVGYEVNPSYIWPGYRDIYLTNLEYYMSEEQAEMYDYITLDNNKVTLTQFTPASSARISVKGTFATGEVYDSIVNIIIATGKYTELLEVAFNTTQWKLDQVDVLYNLLTTREKSGMKNESGAFEMPASYEGYRISYSSNSDIISSIELNVEGTDYVISVDPTKFNNTETRVPLNVTISREDVENTRTMYVTVPAAIHTSDLGNATLFNSAQYQVYSQLPAQEKGGISGFTDGTSIINENKDYILIRDIVGDQNYMEQYHTLDLDYADSYGSTYSSQGCSSLTFVLAEKSEVAANNPTDAKGYDLASLIEWATSKEKVTSASVVTDNANLGSFTNVLSDGKEYLSEDEVAVIKAYYQAVTGISDTQWNSLWISVAEKASGYLISDPDRINRMISNLITNANIQGDLRAETYFKYVETLQWADNEKDFGVQGSHYGDSPNKEKLADYVWTINGATNGDVVFTDALGNTWSRGPGVNWTQTRYHSNANYVLEDNTEYLSNDEIEVLKVLLLNCGAGGLTRAIGKNVVDEFQASLSIPTYFTDDGISNLINTFYQNAEIEVGGLTGFESIKKNQVPAVYNLDGIRAGLDYFGELTQLKIIGNNEQFAFLSESMLSQVFNRLTNNNEQISSLTMDYCAGNYVVFDIENIKNLTELISIDIKNNAGLISVNELVNTQSHNYGHVDFSNSGVNANQNYFSNTVYDFTAYANENMSNSGPLTALAEFNKIVSENMFAVNQVLNPDGETINVTWRIEEGNSISKELVDVAGDYPKISTINEMIQRISPYYYCETAFNYDGTAYQAHHIYKFTANALGTITVTDLGLCTDVDTITNLPEKTESDFVIPTLPDAELTVDRITQTPLTETEGGVTLYEQTVQPAYQGQITSGIQYTLMFSTNTIEIYNNNREHFYLTDTSGALSGTVDSNWNQATLNNVMQNNMIYFAFLTQAQAECLEYIKEGTHTWNEIETRVNSTIGVSITANHEIVFERNTFRNGNQYMIYNPVSEFYFVQPQETYYKSMTTTKTYSANNLYRYQNGVLTGNVTGNRGTANINFDGYNLYTQSGTSTVLTLNSYNIMVPGGGKNEPDLVEFTPTLTIMYKNAGTPNFVVMDVLSITAKVTTEKDSYLEITEKGYAAQSVPLSNPEMIYVEDENTVYLASYIYHHDELVQSKTDKYSKNVSNVLVSYKNINGDVTEIDWDSVNQIVYSYYTTNNEASRIDHVVSYGNHQLQWGNTPTFSVPEDDDVYVFVESQTSGDVTDNPEFEWSVITENVPYISHINPATVNSLAERKATIINVVQDPDNPVYRYTGTGSEEVYKESSISEMVTYATGLGFHNVLSADGLAWSTGTAIGPEQQGGTSMDTILLEANQHFNDNCYGEYYGRYYAYTGEQKTSNSNVTFRTNYIYRIMPNTTNTAFTFVEVKPFMTVNNIDTILMQILNGQVSQADLGNIYFMNLGAANKQNWETRTYYDGFYILTYNEEAGSYFLKTFTDVEYSSSAVLGLASNNALFGDIVRFNNTRINTESNEFSFNGNGYYGGTGGTIPTVISATIHIPGQPDEIRYFKVNIIG